LLGLLVVGALSYGDEDLKKGLRVVNRTDERILVYAVSGAGAEDVLWADIPSGSSAIVRLCGPVKLEARTPDGDVIVERAPSESCAEAWIIEAK
jgi:hypothetical protein